MTKPSEKSVEFPQASARDVLTDVLRTGAAGKAVVTLELDGHGTPIPRSVSIPNKGIDVQSFVQAAEFYIGVREADFQTETPWAAFNVFTIR